MKVSKRIPRCSSCKPQRSGSKINVSIQQRHIFLRVVLVIKKIYIIFPLVLSGVSLPRDVSSFCPPKPLIGRLWLLFQRFHPSSSDKRIAISKDPLHSSPLQSRGRTPSNPETARLLGLLGPLGYGVPTPSPASSLDACSDPCSEPLTGRPLGIGWTIVTHSSSGMTRVENPAQRLGQIVRRVEDSG